MTDIPGSFRGFRIHGGGAPHRSGIEPLSLADLSPGEVVLWDSSPVS